MSNIYLSDLELSLDPAITDPAALKLELEAKIIKWNKLVNSSPKYKAKVSKAKGFLKNGLTNLDAQAREAQTECLKKLRAKIAVLKTVGDINEEGFKMLKGEFNTYVSEDTIRRESGGVAASVPNTPAFVAPICPASLQCEKPIEVRQMKEIWQDFQYVENGRYHNFYQMLNLSTSTPTATLSAKATEESDRIRRITKKDEDVDARNRLIGKACVFFKDDNARQGYDLALKRFPFDLLCDEIFKFLAVNREIPWHVYESSIEETIKTGLNRDEATWLVYDYYCNVKGCPQPVPETPKTTAPTMPSSSPSFGDRFSSGIQSVQNAAGKLTQTVFAPRTPGQEPMSRPAPTEPTSGGFATSVKAGVQWFSEMMRQKHEPLSTTTTVGQFGSLQAKELRKEIQTIRKQYRSSLDQTNLTIVFDQLDSIFTTYHSSFPHQMTEVVTLRAEVGKQLGDLTYAQHKFDVAFRCYHAVLAHKPHDIIAKRCVAEIEAFKMASFGKINILLAKAHYAECIPLIHEVQAKLAQDPEAMNILKLIHTKIDVKMMPLQLQVLQKENKWQTMHDLLEISPVSVQTKFASIKQDVTKRLAEAEKGIGQIRKALQSGQIAQAKVIFDKFCKFITDHREQDLLQGEVAGTWEQTLKIEHEIEVHSKRKNWVRAENELRRFLADNPIKATDLVPKVQCIAAGVANFENKLRFFLFALFGGFLLLATTIVCSRFVSHTYLPEMFSVYTLGTLVAFSTVLWLASKITPWLPFRFRFMRHHSETPPPISWAGLVGIVVVVAVTSYTFIASEDIAQRFVKVLQGTHEDTGGATNAHVLPTIALACVSLALFCCAFQMFCYTHIRRCIGMENRSPSFLLYVCSFVFIPLILVFYSMNQQGELPEMNASVAFSALWFSSCFVVFIDYRKQLDCSFGPEDFVDYFTQRRQLLASLGGSDFAKVSLLDTDWYREVDKRYRLAIKWSPIENTAILSAPPVPVQPVPQASHGQPTSQSQVIPPSKPVSPPAPPLPSPPFQSVKPGPQPPADVLFPKPFPPFQPGQTPAPSGPKIPVPPVAPGQVRKVPMPPKE